MLYVFLGFVVIIGSLIFLTMLNANYKKSKKRVTKRNSQ